MTTTRQRFDGALPPGSLVAHRLNGHYDFRGGASQPGELRSARILESRPLTDEQSTRLRTILTAKASFGGEGMRCFIPGVGFTVGSGAAAIEILVCLQCYWAYLFRGKIRMVEALSEVGHGQIAEMYAELFPGNDPNATLTMRCSHLNEMGTNEKSAIHNPQLSGVADLWS